MTTEERKRIVDDAVAYVERVFAKARARNDAHVFTLYDYQRGEYVARLMAEAAERDDDDAAGEHDDDGYCWRAYLDAEHADNMASEWKEWR